MRPYTFLQDTTIGAQTATFTVLSSFSPPQAVSAAYVVVWAPVATTDGWFSKRPRLAWKVDGNNQPIYMPALACVTRWISRRWRRLVSTHCCRRYRALRPTMPNHC